MSVAHSYQQWKLQTLGCRIDGNCFKCYAFVSHSISIEQLSGLVGLWVLGLLVCEVTVSHICKEVLKR